MEEIKNFFLGSPGLALIILGIVGFIWAITGGGLKTKWISLPVIVDTPRKITYILSGVVLALGVIIHFNNEIAEKPIPEPKPIVDDNINDEPDKVDPPEPRTFKIEGVLEDVFSNRLGSKDIAIRKEDSEIDISITADDGSFEFDNLTEDGIHTIHFLDTIKKYDLKKDKPVSAELFYVPWSGFKITLCRGFIWEEGNKMPLKPYTKDDIIIIDKDSLEMVEDTKERLLGCFIQMWGDQDYTKDKDLKIYLHWYFDKKKQKGDIELPIGMNRFDHGWRTRGVKKVWMGSWMLEVRTETGFLIDRIYFEVI